MLLDLFKLYAPRLHVYYDTTLQALVNWSSNLHRIFPNSVFAAATVNTGGPRGVIAYPHLDYKNLSWGWCSITALGDFDADYGGHLVLWDLNLVIRFPPGATIIIPSAILRHSNLLIRAGETRYSFTQYSAGALFRFVHNNFKANNKLSKKQLKASDGAGRDRWTHGLEMLSTFEEQQSLFS